MEIIERLSNYKEPLKFVVNDDVSPCKDYTLARIILRGHFLSSHLGSLFGKFAPESMQAYKQITSSGS